MRTLLAALALALAAPAGHGQDLPPSPVVTVDQDRLFAGSLWGQRVKAELEAASQALQAENRKIEAALTAEEKALTDRRASLPAAEFRALADEFDKRVTGIRAAQDQKVREFTERQEAERRKFFDAAAPVMAEAMKAEGAYVMLDARAVLLTVRSIDVTDAMRAAIDAKLGDGTSQP